VAYAGIKKEVCPEPFASLHISLSLGLFLEERFIDCKTLLCWSHQSIWHVIVQRYFTRVDKIKQSHKDIADLFLDSWAVNKQVSPDLSAGWRCISQQPLLYSEAKYNLRRLSELWYQLLHAGGSTPTSVSGC